MPAWTCPDCGRVFNRANTRHSCGTGDRTAMLAGKPAALVALYEELERMAGSQGEIEIVAKDRYALFRTTRIFADVVLMKDALRLALQLERVIDDPMFFKTVQDERGRVQQVVKLHNAAELRAVEPYLLEAWRCASKRGPTIAL
ncbi:hypothetical protein IP90_02347 [Luteimonas cucumeris]|uniref:DUF5655 domain-containing protein n=1 Tax=Luteimonas cucumeris TaxID=985012 RepID=A0A562L2B5_9GAMM|nr:DUF5655 domain-containing protein [Luteimonas cucumeris]TWI01787.1 hypothetical protein IP90_02347 [Luteimonas cucumeris]